MNFLTELRMRAGLHMPKTVMARLGVLLTAITVPLYLVGMLIPAVSRRGWYSPSLTFLIWFLSVVLLLLGYRWLRQNLMWRLRNRLVVTYIFIGVIPVLLLIGMGLVAGYLFAGQFATFVITQDISQELQRLEAGNGMLASDLSVKSADPRFSGEDVVKAAHERLGSEFPGRNITAWVGKKAIVVGSPGEMRPIEVPEYAKNTPSFRSLVLDVDSRIYLRAVNTVESHGVPVSVVASVPISPELLKKIVQDGCLVTIQPPDAVGKADITPATTTPGPKAQGKAPDENGLKFRFGSQNDNSVVTLQPGSGSSQISAGNIQQKRFFLDAELPFGTALALKDWQTGKTTTGLLAVRTRPSTLYDRLFRTLGEYSNVILSVLGVVAILFAIIEIVALFIGVRLTRTMTASVAHLYNATQHIETGQLAHRIHVTRDDQLAALERSFNSMTDSLQKLIVEQKEKQRIEGELAIAQEVQALLFPRDISSVEGFEVHGVCRPARTVSGDYYDFLPVGPNQLGLAVGDISGKGISAALLMATVHAFVRAYTLVESVPALQAVGAGTVGLENSLIRMSAPGGGGDLPPGTLLAMLNHQLYRSTPSEKYATMFLGFYDARTRQFNYSNAGHLPPVLIGNDGKVRALETGGLVVGLFGDVTYNDDSVELSPGDIFLAYSDGITEPENEFGEFGEERLIALVHENRHLPLDRISDIVVAAVTDWIGGNEQPDDITLVLARAQ